MNHLRTDTCQAQQEPSLLLPDLDLDLDLADADERTSTSCDLAVDLGCTSASTSSSALTALRFERCERSFDNPDLVDAGPVG